MNKIQRDLVPEQLSFRAVEEDGKRYLEGYASVFGKRSKPIYEDGKLFYEIIDRSAFDEVLAQEDLNVKLVFNHNGRDLLGRTKSGTLDLSTDETGLKFRALVPQTTLGNDVYELVSRGDLAECSFAFAIKKGDDVWTRDDNGDNVRTINKVARLYDVAIVVDGAYANTDVFARQNQEDVETRPPIVEGETEEEYMNKCIPYVIENGEAEDDEQAYAICKATWDESQESDEEMEEDSRSEVEKMRMHVTMLKLKK